MAQFGVHRNKGALRESIPFVVLVQSAQIDGYCRRVVVPLVRRSLLPASTPTTGRRINPAFQMEGIEVVLHPLDMVSVSVEQLGRHIGSLADHGQSISDALGELLTRS
jgi:toxin CcdB